MKPCKDATNKIREDIAFDLCGSQCIGYLATTPDAHKHIRGAVFGVGRRRSVIEDFAVVGSSPTTVLYGVAQLAEHKISRRRKFIHATFSKQFAHINAAHADAGHNHELR